MIDVDGFARSYLIVDVDRDATASAVAGLLEMGAAALRARGPVTVHHLAFETVDDTRRTAIILTIYFDNGPGH